MSNLLSQASLVMIPSGYKEDKVYSAVPTDGSGDLSFTRASNGTRVNSAGLVEVCPWNLLLNTNTFSGWSLEGGTLTSGFNAPDGSSTAYKYVQTTGGIYSGSATATSGNKTVSVWLKSVSGTSITCNLQDGGSSNATTVTVTGDWQLFTFTYTTSTSRPALYIYSISNASGIYLWHPQLNEGSTAKPYFPTTDRLNVPRLTYQNGGGGCPSLLLEPQRTNTMLYSQAINSWATKTELTITDNNATSPDGTTDASYIQQTTGGNAVTLNSQTVTVTTGQVQTISFYAKAKEVTSISLRLGGVTIWAGGIRPIFTCDLSNGTISVQTGSITVSSESVGNGWYRFVVVTAATIASGAASLQTPTGAIFSSTSGDGFYLWGVQWEQNASYPTSYIPTTTASATRVADAFSRNNIYTNGLITSSGGTWFVELLNNVALGRDNSNVSLYLGDNLTPTNGNGLYLVNGGGTDRLTIWKRVSGSGGFLYTTITSTVKMVIKWNGSTADVFVNGTKVVSASSFTTTLMEYLYCASGGPCQTEFISQMDLFPTPLTDAECIALTTL